MLALLALLLVAGEGEPPPKPATGGFWPAPATAAPAPEPAPGATPPPGTPAPPASPEPPPPQPPATFWPAPVRPAPPPPVQLGKPVTVLGGLVLGATDQVASSPNPLLGLELGFLAVAGALRMGALTSFGTRRDAGAWSLALELGKAFPRPDGARVELLGELGLQGYWLFGSDGLLGSRKVDGGGATLPFVGARLLFARSAEHGGVAIGLFLQQTLGSTTQDYQVTDCSFLGFCSVATRTIRYGGLAGGIILDLTHTYRSTSSGAQPSADPAAAPGP